jgi:hypothetical protein
MAKLDGYAVGIADPDVAELIEDHLDSCDECARRLKALTDSTDRGLPGEHLPERMIATWDRAQRSLRGLERELARRHLVYCATCREEIEMLGSSATLEIVPELEPEAATLVRLRPPEPILVPRSQRSGGISPRKIVWRHRLGDWILGGLAGGLATAAALLIAFSPWREAPSIAPPTRPSVEGPVARLSWVSLSDAADLHGPLRSAAAPETTVVHRRGTDPIPLRLPGLMASPETPVQVAVRGPAKFLAEIDGTVRDVADRMLLLEGGSHDLASGDYDVVVTVGPDPRETGGGPRRIESVMRLISDRHE